MVAITRLVAPLEAAAAAELARLEVRPLPATSILLGMCSCWLLAAGLQDVARVVCVQLYVLRHGYSLYGGWSCCTWCFRHGH